MSITVLKVNSSREKEIDRKNGPGSDTFVSYKMDVRDDAGKEIKNADWFVKKDLQPAAPEPGFVITDSYIKQGDYGPQIKKNAKLGGGGGFRPRDPRETAAIQRQHSQEMAVRVAVAAGWFEGFSAGQKEEAQQILSDVARLSDWFQRDIQRGVNLEQYGSKPETRKEQVRTGKSDIPEPAPGAFEHERQTGMPDDLPIA